MVLVLVVSWWFVQVHVVNLEHSNFCDGFYCLFLFVFFSRVNNSRSSKSSVYNTKFPEKQDISDKSHPSAVKARCFGAVGGKTSR